MTESASARLDTIGLFCRAAETLSFTAAADLAGTTPSAVSKAVRRLEDQLGIRLFERTTRAICLTTDGAAYHAACRDALETIQHAETELAGRRKRPQGTLRVSLPPSYGIVDLVPDLPGYIARHQRKLKVVACFSNSLAQFVSEGIDVAVRIGAVTDSRLVARRLRDAEVRVVASPRYLRRHGAPAQPEDLRSHQCIDLVLPGRARPMPWEFRRGARPFKVNVDALLAVDQPMAALSAAIASGGLARLLDFTVAHAIDSGELVEVLQEFRPPPVPVSIVYPTARHMSANVRSFVDFVTGR